MKKLIFIAFAFMFYFSSIAQITKLNSISTYLRNYTTDKDVNELLKAKDNVDAIINHEDTKLLPKAWLAYGQTYHAILTEPKLSEKVSNALDLALEGYKKAKELDAKNKFKNEIQNGLDACAIASINKGVELYSAKEFSSALTYFEKGLEIKSMRNTTVSDTGLILNTALTAVSANDNTKAIKYFEQLDNINADLPAIYTGLYDIYAPTDINKANNYLEKGLKRFPNDQNLIYISINKAISEGKGAEIKTKLEDMITKDPKNGSLKTVLAQIYYNEGADIVNKTNDLVKKMNDTNDQKEYDKLKEQKNNLFNQAIPLFEKSLSVTSSFKNSIIALKEIYAKLGNFDKSNEYKKMLE